MNSLICLIGAIAIIAFYYFYKLNYWKRRGVRTFRPNLLFGNLSDVFLRKTHTFRMFKEVYDTCKERGDKFMGFYFLNTPSLVITDPELLKQVFIKDFNHFTDRHFYLDKNDPLTLNIASAKGSQWRKMREQFSPAFSPGKLKNVCLTSLQVGDQLKSALDKSAEHFEVVNLQDVSCMYMIDAIGMSIFGIECNTLKGLNKEFKKFAENAFGGSNAQNIKLALSILCPAVLRFFKIPVNSPKTQKFYLNLVKSIVNYREQNNIVRNDLMHLMIQLRNNINIEEKNNADIKLRAENEKSLNIEEITAHILLFFGAAYETSSSAISLSVYELASNEDVQKMLRKEIANVLKKYDGKLHYDAIMEMTYLDKCVSEVLRKHPMVGITARTCTEEYQLPDSDVVLEVGTTVHIPIYEFHHDPKYYPNPDNFDPERFSSESKLSRPNYTYLPFGDGPRNCIGARLAILQIKIFLVTFLRNYNFTINSKVKLPPTFSKTNLVMNFETPLYLNIEKL